MFYQARSISFADVRSKASPERDTPPPLRIGEEAFRALYQQSAGNLQAYIRRACGDAALAEDILQDTFYRFLRADLNEMHPSQAKTYLYRTASTLLADHWRRQKRERRWNLWNFLSQEPSTRSESDGEAMRTFRGLKPQEQNLLWLAYVEGFSHSEIAEVLALKEKSVRVLLFRAREKLAHALRKSGVSPEVNP
jgi:RNA polymerase sigma-70 factor (ECF subfamily)